MTIKMRPLARAARLHIILPAIAGSLFAYSAAHAQSTGSQVEQGEVVVTGAKQQSTGGLAVVTHEAKDQFSLTQTFLSTQVPSQNFAQAINLLPGVSYSNEDPTGASPGDFRMQGFDGAHVSFTIDGMPLNDTGNYAIYPSEYVQSAVIDHITVNLGQTEVDSPTASAIGGTVNIVSKTPPSTAGAIASVGGGSYGDVNAYGEIDTGAVGPTGVRSYLALGYLDSDKYKGAGTLNRWNLDGNIYQPLNGSDFVGVAFSYAQVRNYFYESNSIAQYNQFGRNIDFNTQWAPPQPNGSGVYGSFPTTTSTPSEPSAPGFEQGNDSNYWKLHPNPTDFGDIRAHSRFDLSHNVTLAVDPYFFYTLANGGGATYISEKDKRLVGAGGTNACGTNVGVDLNGNGNCNDSVLVYSPSNTQTHRYGVNSSLIWDLNPQNRFQLAYTYDDGHHRQTGEMTPIDQATGTPDNIFGAKQGYGPAIVDLDGTTLRKRDRFSVAELNQISANYVGKFMDDKLHVNVGLRDPMFTRNLNEFCYVYNGGTEYCDSAAASSVTAAMNADNSSSSHLAGSTATNLTNLLGVTVKYGTATNGPNTLANFRLPFKATYHFDKVLPNAGLSYDFDGRNSAYLTFAEGFSAPKTDDLYVSTAENVQPETTFTYGAGYRYHASALTLSSNLFYTTWQNHIVQSFDPTDPTLSIDRNVGTVDLYGLELESGWQVTEALTLYATATLEKSRLENNYEVATSTGIAVPLPVKGKELVLTPDQMVTGRAQYKFEDFAFGLDLKYEGSRYIDDINSAGVDPFVTADFDAAYHFQVNNVKSTLQLNVYNLTGTKYFVRSSTVGNATPVVTPSGTVNASSYFLSTGAPTTVYVTLKAAF
jgi:iron complex outermembrane receptor protein